MCSSTTLKYTNFTLLHGITTNVIILRILFLLFTGLPCCMMSSSTECQNHCKHVLNTRTSEEEIVNGIISTCGPPSLSVRSSQYNKHSTHFYLAKNMVEVMVEYMVK